jgi:hypothetical protein
MTAKSACPQINVLPQDSTKRLSSRFNMRNVALISSNQFVKKEKTVKEGRQSTTSRVQSTPTDTCVDGHINVPRSFWTVNTGRMSEEEDTP